jgi:hypothetical protein
LARMGEESGVHRVLVGKPEGQRPLGIPRRRWEDNIKMDLKLSMIPNETYTFCGLKVFYCSLYMFRAN